MTADCELVCSIRSTVFDEIESTGRTRHARRREVVVNGCCRAGSGVTRNALRLVLDRDDVSARSRCVKLHGHGAGRSVLRDVRVLTNTVGVKHIAPAVKVELAGEVARRDRLSDRKGVAAGWRRHHHPVEEHTGGDVLRDLRRVTADAVIQDALGLGRAVHEL